MSKNINKYYTDNQHFIKPKSKNIKKVLYFDCDVNNNENKTKKEKKKKVKLEKKNSKKVKEIKENLLNENLRKWNEELNNLLFAYYLFN